MREETTAHGQLDQAQPQPSLAAPAWVYGKAAGAHRAGATLEPDAAQAKESLLKRPFDLFVAAVGLLIASPLWLVFSVAIKLEDRGPILFVQDRGGKGQDPHTGVQVSYHGPQRHREVRQHPSPGTRPPGDEGRTPAEGHQPGRDAQLWNIARGDMSWVGPRALPIDEAQVHEEGDLPDEAIPGFEARSRLRPGLTGIAQIFAPRDIPRQQKYRYDAIYATSQSLWLDIRLIFISLWITLRARWEAREKKY